MTTGTRLFVLLLLVGTFWVEAEDVTCGPKKTTKKITIEDGDSFTFKTQAGTKYGGKVKCSVTYTRDQSCPAMRFSCDTFALSSTKDTCQGGDKMAVVANGVNQKYCQNNSPDETTTGKSIKVKFTSNRNGHDSGAECRVECLSEETTTTAPVTTTPTIPPTTPTIPATTPTIPPTTPTIPTTTEGETTALSADYCALGADHTMCKYSGPSTACAAMTKYSGISEAGKQAILDKHNELRRRVAKGEETGGINPPQPGASDMRKLVWNDELALIAQRLTDQCVFAHDDNRNLLDGTQVGQNLYIGFNSVEKDEASTNAAMDGPAQSWYDEVTDPGFDSTGVASYVFDSGTGHYTQLVWAETGEIGCGMTYYKEGDWYKTLVNCNYAKAGNWLGNAMYTSGASCTACPTGYTCDDGLCVAP